MQVSKVRWGERQRTTERVLLLTAGRLDRATGGNVYNRHLIRALEEAGIEIEVATALASPTESRTVLIDSVAMATGLPLVCDRPAGTRVIALMYALPSILSRRRLFRRPLRRLETSFLQHVDFILAVSPEVARWVRRLGVADALVRIVPPGKDAMWENHEVSAARSAPGRGLRLLCVANWFPVKNVHVLVDAMGRLPDDVTLDLVGDPEADPAYSARVRRAILALPANRVRVHGPVAPERLGSFYSAADTVVQPSAYESYGMAVAEALWMGRPVIASNTGGLADLITDGREGFLVPPGRVRPLARAIKVMRDNPSLRDRMGSAARLRAESLPSWRLVHETLREVLIPFIRGVHGISD